MCSYKTDRNSLDSWNCYQWMAISHLLFHLVSLFPQTRDNEEIPASIGDLIWVSYGLKCRESWNLINFGLKSRVLKGDRTILSVKPPNTRRLGRKYDLDERRPGITLEPSTKLDQKKKKKNCPKGEETEARIGLQILTLLKCLCVVKPRWSLKTFACCVFLWRGKLWTTVSSAWKRGKARVSLLKAASTVLWAIYFEYGVSASPQSMLPAMQKQRGVWFCLSQQCRGVQDCPSSSGVQEQERLEHSWDSHYRVSLCACVAKQSCSHF